ncbi:hypothetical protein PENTCL1PPCAC_25843, partial [Pristionchus entomophagus]
VSGRRMVLRSESLLMTNRIPMLVVKDCLMPIKMGNLRSFSSLPSSMPSSTRKLPTSPAVVKVLKPAMILHDVKLKARNLPEQDFELPKDMNNAKVIRKTKAFCRSPLADQAKSKPAETKKEVKAKKKKKVEKTASTTQTKIEEKKEVNLERKKNDLIGMKNEKTAPTTPSTSSLPKRPPVINVKNPIDIASTSSLPLSTQPKVQEECPENENQKRALVETILAKIAKEEKENGGCGSFSPCADAKSKKEKMTLASILGKMRENGGSISSSAPTTSVSPSIELVVIEGRKNKRKSNEPSKFTDELEIIPMRKRGRKKGENYKKKGGRTEPSPKMRKREDEEGGDTEIVQTEAIYDDEGLSPRIIVEGQEPGTVLEWDEEEIIILRVGEKPEQRPPRMKRKMAPEERFEE